MYENLKGWPFKPFGNIKPNGIGDGPGPAHPG